ncbi:MAG: mechanosensitive ion channel family protein [Solobacterium sp.]|nr:mechanosensitive ion channel family protein [Solobacterium sp.]
MLKVIENNKILFLLLLFVLTWGIMQLNRLVFKQIRAKKKDGLKLKYFERLSSALILLAAVIAAFAIFDRLGTVWKTLLGGTAIISAVLAFTAQDIIKDILAGFMISMYKPFDIGDRIQLENGTVGIVIDITMRHVVIKFMDTTVCAIPNSKLNAMSILNFSYHSQIRSRIFSFSIAYDSDVRKAINVIREAIISSSYSIPGVKRDYGMDYAPVYFMEFQSSSLLLQTTVFYPPEVQTEVLISDINLRVDLALNENGIEIPYNFVNVVNRELGVKQDGGELVRSGRPYVTADIVVTADGKGMKKAIETTEKFGTACGLTKKEVMRLRLLSEESLTMMRDILQNSAASYHIARTKDTYYLHLKSGINTDDAQRRQLLSVSTSGINAAPMGLMDRISEMVRTSQSGKLAAQQAFLINLGITAEADNDGTLASWSLQQYRQSLATQKNSSNEAAEAWDELERSIVSSIADDISVRITRSTVTMIIKKTF